MFSIGITVKKELRSILRDKRTLITLLAFPLFIPLIIFLYSYMYESTNDSVRYSIGINYEPNMMEISILDEVNLDYVVVNELEELEELYSKKDIIGYIYYTDDKYYMYVNSNSEDGMYASNYMISYLEGYNNYLAELYLIGEDIDVDLVYDNINYEVIELEGENFLLQMMFVISFTYIIMAIVMATTNMATAATAVEKENGTLETLLTFPVKVKDLIIGKYLAIVIMGIIASIIGLVLALSSLGIAVNTQELFSNISLDISIISIVLSIIVVVLASLFIGGISLVVTSFAKSYKEAQSMCSMLNIVTVIPMFISLLGMNISYWYYLIPIVNYTQILLDIFSGNVDIISILMVVISSIVYVILVIFYILKQYKYEKIFFS